MANGTAKERLGNVSKLRDIPSRYGDVVGQKGAYSVIEFVEVVPADKRGTADKDGETWFKLPDGKYVNYQLRNSSGVLVDYFDILTQPSNPPPDPTGYPVTVTVTDSDGWYGEGTITVKPK